MAPCRSSLLPPSLGSRTTKPLTQARTRTAFRHARSDRIQGRKVRCHRAINNKKSAREDSFRVRESGVERSAHHLESGHEHDRAFYLACPTPTYYTFCTIRPYDHPASRCHHHRYLILILILAHISLNWTLPPPPQISESGPQGICVAF